MSPPGKDEMPPVYVCEEAQKGDLTYELVGDVETFFENEDVVSGMVKINVPFSAVKQDYQINFDEETIEQISVSYDHHRRKLMSTSGITEMLVVRVSDDDSSDSRRIVSQTETRMYWYVPESILYFVSINGNTDSSDLSVFKSANLSISTGTYLATKTTW